MRVSRLLLLYGGLSHILAGVAVYICSAPYWLKLGLFVTMIATLCHFMYQYALPNSTAFIRSIEHLDGRWRIESGDGQVCYGQVVHSYSHPWLMVVNFQCGTGQRRSVVLLSDTADREQLRRLRVWLRIQRHPPAAS